MIYSRASFSRRKPYQFLTQIIRRGEGMVVVKSALSPEAKQGVVKLGAKRKQLVELEKHFRLVPVKITDGEAISPFIHGPTLEEKFEDSIVKGNLDATVEIFDHIVSAIDKLGTVKAVPSNDLRFKELFGDGWDEKTDCLTCGYIDFNLDNFIDSPEGLTLIDYEWTFDFPVPRDLVVGRLFYSYFTKRTTSLTLQYLCSPQLELAELYEGFYLPKILYEKFKARLGSLDKVAASEKQFQTQVSYTDGSGFNFKPLPRARYHSRPIIQGYLDWTEQRLIPQLAKLNDPKGEIARLEAELKAMQDRLSKIETHPIWKLQNSAKRMMRRRSN